MINNILLENEEYILTRYKNTLSKQGINTVGDLLSNFPVKYEDYTVSSIHDAVVDENIVLEPLDDNFENLCRHQLLNKFIN